MPKSHFYISFKFFRLQYTVYLCVNGKHMHAEWTLYFCGAGISNTQDLHYCRKWFSMKNDQGHLGLQTYIFWQIKQCNVAQYSNGTNLTEKTQERASESYLNAEQDYVSKSRKDLGRNGVSNWRINNIFQQAEVMETRGSPVNQKLLVLPPWTVLIRQKHGSGNNLIQNQSICIIKRWCATRTCQKPSFLLKSQAKSHQSCKRHSSPHHF